jgi:tetratricopeptide (TPR) repeat protein
MLRTLTLILTALFLTALPLARASDPLGLSSLLQLPATNAIVFQAEQAAPPPAPVETNSRLLALRQLARMPASTNQSLRLPELDGIQTLAPAATSKDRNVDEVFEEIKVRDILKEAEDLRRNGKGLLALGMIQSNLLTVASINSRFELHSQLGVIYHTMKDFAAAAEAMGQALDLKPESAMLACNLAATHLYLNQPDQALEALGRIQMSILPPAEKQRVLYFAHFNYACAFSLKSKIEEGLTHLELASRQDPARTLGDMGDPQLDNLRPDARFQQLKDELEARARGAR